MTVSATELNGPLPAGPPCAASCDTEERRRRTRRLVFCVKPPPRATATGPRRRTRPPIVASSCPPACPSRLVFLTMISPRAPSVWPDPLHIVSYAPRRLAPFPNGPSHWRSTGDWRKMEGVRLAYTAAWQVSVLLETERDRRYVQAEEQREGSGSHTNTTLKFVPNIKRCRGFSIFVSHSPTLTSALPLSRLFEAGPSWSKHIRVGEFLSRCARTAHLRWGWGSACCISSLLWVGLVLLGVSSQRGWAVCATSEHIEGAVENKVWGSRSPCVHCRGGVVCNSVLSRRPWFVSTLGVCVWKVLMLAMHPTTR